MKRNHLVLIVCFFFTGTLFATGAGIQVEAVSPLNFRNVNLDEAVEYSVDYEFMVLGTIKSDRFPIVAGAGINLFMEEGRFFLGGAGFFDFPFFDWQVKNNWNMDIGAGVTYTIKYSEVTGGSYSLGEHVFWGTNWSLYDGYLELYIQQNVENKRIGATNSQSRFLLCFPTDIGVRWHF